MLHRYLALAVLVFACAATAQAAGKEGSGFDPSPHAIDIPPWFRETFLDFREDLRDAAKAGRRLLVYFGQDGCPYCRELMRVNFADKRIADKTRAHFDAVAINIWGDREVVWTDGKHYTEKTLAALLKVQFTPSLLFFDEEGKVALRLNGYYPPHRFQAALDYVAGRHERKEPFAPFLQRHAREPASGKLHEQPFFLKPPHDFDRSRRAAAKPLAIVFEQKSCAACDEMHAYGFRRPATRALIAKFDVARLELFGEQDVVTPAGKRLREAEWARELNVAYTPTLLFFDARGREVFRVEAYLRPFHLASSFDYVASGAYRTQPNFQRFLQARAEKIRAAGGEVDLW